MKKFLQLIGLGFVLLVVISAIVSASKKSDNNTGTVNDSTIAPAAVTATPASNSAAPSSPTTSAAPSSNLTESQQNAVQAAQSYLQLSGFSKQGLIDQLSSSAGDGYSLHDATVAVDTLSVNWNAQAVRSAKDYLKLSSFSCEGLTQQLDSSAGDQYTPAQTQYAATQVGLC